jgi:hypothetical protein
VKLAEIAIMLLAGAGFFLHAAGPLMAALFLMGCHSAFLARSSTPCCRNIWRSTSWSAATA